MRALPALQAAAGNVAVSRLIADLRRGPAAGLPSGLAAARPAGPLVIQRLAAHQTFKTVLAELVQTLGATSRVGAILRQNKDKNAKPSADSELGILFRAAWPRGDENADSQDDDDRRMMENLIRSGTYGIGDAVRDARLALDKEQHFGSGPSGADATLVSAFQQALFFRAERVDSNGVANGFLAFDGTKHGRMGSARDMPGKRGEGVRDRADGYLFVSKEGKEVRDYQAKAQGGTREVLTIVASREEAQAMVYDVDSRGYKTRNRLTGIVSNVMTPRAIENLNTWLKVKQTSPAVLDPILQHLIS